MNTARSKSRVCFCVDNVEHIHVKCDSQKKTSDDKNNMRCHRGLAKMNYIFFCLALISNMIIPKIQIANCNTVVCYFSSSRLKKYCCMLLDLAARCSNTCIKTANPSLLFVDMTPRYEFPLLYVSFPTHE